jgi:hypothetical protein
MNTPLPAHLVAGIRQRIAWLREAWQIDEIYAPRELAGYPTAHRRHETVRPGATAPTFPQPHSNDARSRS